MAASRSSAARSSTLTGSMTSVRPGWIMPRSYVKLGQEVNHLIFTHRVRGERTWLSFALLLPQIIQGIDHALVSLREQVPVGPERHRDVRVPEPSLHEDRVRPGVDCQRSGRVPEVVE